MDIRRLTANFSVAPQLLPEELAAVAAAGFTTVICNRPDQEVGPDMDSAAMKAAAEAAGITWVSNEIISGAMTVDNIKAQGQIVSDASGPVVAYCRSGTRSATAWSFAMADALGVDAVVDAAAKGGYDFAPMRSQIEKYSQQG